MKLKHLRPHATPSPLTPPLPNSIAFASSIISSFRSNRNSIFRMPSDLHPRLPIYQFPLPKRESNLLAIVRLASWPDFGPPLFSPRLHGMTSFVERNHLNLISTINFCRALPLNASQGATHPWLPSSLPFYRPSAPRLKQMVWTRIVWKQVLPFSLTRSVVGRPTEPDSSYDVGNDDPRYWSDLFPFAGFGLAGWRPKMPYRISFSFIDL